MGTFEIAQICLNGHVITKMAGEHPENRKQYCTECGEGTIMTCQNCNIDIKGYHYVPGVIGAYEYHKPKYCEKCGQAFPWTDRQLKAAKELIDLSDSLNSEEKHELQSSITDLIKGGPQTIVAQARYKKYIEKAGSEVAKSIRDILVDVVSETVKQAIWGQ